MGIPRLSQDVAPYAETAILGKAVAGSTAIQVTKVVIDGPSMVYHIWNALQSYWIVSRSGVVDVVSTYDQINACMYQFLRDLTDNDTQITAIVFDGALPPSKRPVRQQRLEQTRLNLENYRKLQPHFRVQYGCRNGIMLSSTTFREALWGQPNVGSSKQRLLPPPPFMVASAIESLRGSEWAIITHVVPGEADVFCAAEAADSGSAVLSNDSDLLLYDLGSDGKVVLLRTLELSDHIHPTSIAPVQGQCFRPIQIAARLGVSSMLMFGYHRYVNPPLTTSAVIQRTRDFGSMGRDSAWLKFCGDYQVIALARPGQNIDGSATHVPTHEFDPRTGELASSLQNFEALHVYLPTTLEDPSKDSAWSYGTNLRQIAYSILLQHHDGSHGPRRYSSVTEFARKGSRIAESNIQLLHRTTLCEQIEGMVTILRNYLDRNGEKFMGNHEQDSTASKKSISMADTVFRYYLLSADFVIRQRLVNAKTYRPDLFHLFPFSSRSQFAPMQPTWEDIHMHASIQCVLYSLRMLKQIVDCVYQSNQPQQSDVLLGFTRILSLCLESMPAIADIFLDIETLHRSWFVLKPSSIADGVREMIKRADPSSVAAGVGDNAIETKTIVLATLDGKQQTDPVENKWQELKPRPKKRRVGGNLSYTPARNENIGRVVSRRGHDIRGNGFALLAEGNDVSDLDE